jgi:hypothetical protein
MERTSSYILMRRILTRCAEHGMGSENYSSQNRGQMCRGKVRHRCDYSKHRSTPHCFNFFLTESARTASVHEGRKEDATESCGSSPDICHDRRGAPLIRRYGRRHPKAQMSRSHAHTNFASNATLMNMNLAHLCIDFNALSTETVFSYSAYDVKCALVLNLPTNLLACHS